MRGRPLLHTSYESDQALLNTTTKKVMVGLLLLVLLLVPHGVLPIVGFLGDADWLRLLTQVFIFAIGAMGLNILTGMAGQVSLGHAFFMGIGAYTAAWFGDAPGPLVGMGLPMWIWLPAAGIVAALVGLIIGPTAMRVRGLYLAFVTLGLVFVGEYLFRRFASVTGGSQSGRGFPRFEIRLWKEEEPLIDFSRNGSWFGVELSSTAKTFYFLLILLVIAVILAKNVQRTRPGRAFQAIRDRDIAAGIMGVEEFKYKMTAFGISSFYAGVAGALLAVFVGRMLPETWNLFMSVQFIAIILIGGAGVVSGVLLGSLFVIALPRVVLDLATWLVEYVRAGEGMFVGLADLIVSTGPFDWGLINTESGLGPGLSVAQVNLVLYGLLIILFLMFEPLGLYGIWLRIRNYWKSWPFTY